MTREEFIEFSKKFTDEALETMNKKSKDYNPNGIMFDDLKQTAETLGTHAEGILYIAFSKHRASLEKYIQIMCKYTRTDRAVNEADERTSEPIEERLHDLINYCILIAAAIKEDRPKHEDPSKEE